MSKTVIKGNCPSKSNSYKIIKIGNHYSLGKTAQLKIYEDNFAIQASKLRNLNIEKEFEFVIDVYYDSKRPDLDNSLKVVLDCLQKVKAIKNDNKCISIKARKFKDKLNPRIEFEVIPVYWQY